MSVCNLRPESRGTCHVTTTKLDAQPEIKPNYLSTAHDRSIAIKSIHQVRRIMTAKALERYAPTELLPGPEVRSDDDLVKEVGNIATHDLPPGRDLQDGQ